MLKIDGIEKHRVRIGGKFNFSSLPADLQISIKKRLAEKDSVMAKGIQGILPGIKIDGKEVTKDNIHEFEIAKMPDKTKTNVENTEGKYTKKDLEELNFNELKKIGKKFGTTDRSKTNLIKEILQLQ